MASESPTALPQAERPRPAVWCGLLLLLVLFAYLPSLDGPFVWDDTMLIEHSPLVTTLHRPWDYFTLPFWTADEIDTTTRAFYRPLTTWTYALDYRLHGANSTGFHLTNVVLHAACTAMLFALLRRRDHSGLTAAILAGLWALLPRLAESVAWISGRTDVLASFWVLVALLVWKPTPKRRIGTALALTLGLFSKEVALAGFAAVFVLECTDGKRGLGQRLGSCLPLAVGLSGYGITRLYAMAHAPPVLTSEVQGLRRFTLVLEALGTYLRMTLLPFPAETQIGCLLTPNVPRIALGIALLLALSGLFLLARHKPSLARALRTIAPWSALTATALGLVSHLAILPISVVAYDHYLYLPLLGLTLCIPISWLRSQTALPALALLLAPLTWATHARAQLWADPIELWSEACRKAPSSFPLPCMELGNQEYFAGNVERAQALYQSLSTDLGLAYRVTLNRAILQARLGNYLAAYELTREAIALDPKAARGYHEQATMAVRLFRFDEAKQLFERAVVLYPQYQAPRQALERLPTLRQLAYNLDPGRVDPWELAERFMALGHVQEAEKLWLQFVDSPTDPRQVQLAALRLGQEGTAEAVAHSIDRLRCAATNPLVEPVLCAGLVERQRRSQKLKALTPDNELTRPHPTCAGGW